MRGPPAVTYPVVRSRSWGWTLGLLWCCGALLSLLWCAQQNGFGWRGLLAAAVLLAGAAALVVDRKRAPVGSLCWDGAGWFWLPDGAVDAQPVRLAVQVDLQHGLLVWLHPLQGAGRWLWLERRTAPALWHGLRLAVHARAGDAQEPGPSPSG